MTEEELASMMWGNIPINKLRQYKILSYLEHSDNNNIDMCMDIDNN